MEEIIEITDSPEIVTNQRKLAELGTKREAEIAHSNYIKRNIADPVELRRANETVNYWVHRNGIKNTPILGTRSNQQSYSTTPSRHNNQSNQRAGVSKNSSKSTTINGKPKKKLQNSRETVDNEGQDCDSPSQISLELIDPDYAAVLRSSSPNVINLVDETFHDSNDSLEILNVSNNSNSPCNTPTGRSKRKYITRQTSCHICPILNCEAVFTSEGALGQHKNLFKHSPCNPCLKVLDCKISADPQCFMCPECDNAFQTAEACRKHMKSRGHLTFLPPLSIMAYMCAHCLHVFETYLSCWEHIEQSRHRDIAYPFVDDQGPNAEDGIGPVPVAEELLQDFIQKCGKIPYRVQCLECTLDIENPAVLRHHMMETNNQHIVSVLSDTNLVDVFAGYLAGYTCDTCHRLFNGGIKELAKHQCAQRVVGTIVENNSRSFSEFVKRCALSVIKSEDISPTAPPESRPGPSLIGTGLQKRNRRISSTEICKSPLVVSDEDELDLTEGLSDGVAISNKSASKSETKSNSPKPHRKSINKQQTKSDSSSTAPETQGATCAELTEENNTRDNISTISESKRKKTKWDQMTKPSQKHSNDKGAVGTKMLGLPINVNATMSQPSILGACPNQQNTAQPYLFGPQPVQHMPALLPTPTQLPPISGHHSHTSFLQTPSGNQTKNFYCHPSSHNSSAHSDLPFNLSPAGNFRYPLRNQNRNDGSNCISNRPPGKFIRIGQKSANPSPQQDDQVAGPSHMTRSPNEQTMDQPPEVQSLKRNRSRSPVIGADSLVSIENLMNMKNIIFLDLDNWPGFFSKLPRVLPPETFVWGFFGGRIVWKEPCRCFIFKEMKMRGQFYLNEQCGFTKDAADFCIVLSVGKMDALLPTNVAFTILSGDKGFCEVERQMKMSKRKAVVINPHNAEQFSTEMIYTMVTSVTDT